MAAFEPDLRVPYSTVSGVDIPTDIWFPKNPSKACPVLIMIHGGAFMLGSATMNNSDQIRDCVERGWIVLCIEHRLCPGVNVLEGPMTDARRAVSWVHEGKLARLVEEKQEKDEGYWKGKVDSERVMVMGTSSGGHLALSTAWNPVSPSWKPPLAILNFYGAVNFASPSWSTPLDSMPASFREPRPKDEVEALKAEKLILQGGVSLEGQKGSSSSSSPKTDIRLAFAMHAIATGSVIPTIWPEYPDNLDRIDPILNINKSWPPVCIVHGTADAMVPMHLSKALEQELLKNAVECAFIEVEGEGHTFCGKMERGGKTWDTQRRGFDFLEGVLGRRLEVVDG